MKNVILVAAILLAGCIGSPIPRNPMMKRKCPHHHLTGAVNHESICSTPWWRLDTSAMKPEDNPWNKFVPTYKEVDRTDPWAGFESPQLFPSSWKHKAKPRVKPTGSIKKFVPKVEKDARQLYKELKKREREYFEKMRRRKRAI